MILPVYTYGTKVLTTKARPVENVDEQVIKLIMDMFDTMHAANGIGLAANQVGKLHRIIVIDISDIEEKEDSDPEQSRRFKPHPPIALINPEVLSTDGRWSMEEGCLSIPGVRDEVERVENITVRYKDTNFRDVELQADGLLARVILHEIDHLNGELFIDHLSPPKRKEHREQLKKIQKGEFEVEYPVVTAISKKVEAA
jgi:peptide deformylase